MLLRNTKRATNAATALAMNELIFFFFLYRVLYFIPCACSHSDVDIQLLQFWRLSGSGRLTFQLLRLLQAFRLSSILFT